MDLRSPALETLQAAEAEIERICAEHVVPDVTTEVVGHGWHRPMEKKEAAARLVEIAVGVAGELGFELRDAATGRRVRREHHLLGRNADDRRPRAGRR